MEEFPKYQSYKDSGAPWLEEIPSHWQLRKSKYLWREVEDRSKSGNEQLLSVSQYSGITLRNGGSRSESLVDYKQCRPNDLIVNIMLAWLGALGISQHEGIVSPAYCVYRQTADHDSKFLGYLYCTPVYLAEFARRSKGVVPSRWRMYTEDFGQILTILPPLSEQQRIVTFLDQKTAEIDEAINKKQRLIELLQEQKAILINQAVTKGLNPNVPMQDSGTDWIGKIPEHWEVVRLKRTWNILDCKHLTAPFSDKGYPLASIKEVSGKKVNLATASRTNRKFYEKLIEGGRKPLVGDIIYSRNVSVGAAALVDSTEEFALGQDVCLLRSIENHGPYFVHLLRSNAIMAQISHLLVGSTFNRINISQIKELFVCIPPREEQEHIDAYANRIESEFEATIEKAKKEQKVLKEFSRVLISQAVTGKIKV